MSSWTSAETLKTRECICRELDALIRKAHNLGQIEQLTTELRRLRDAIATQMGEARILRARGGSQEMDPRALGDQ